MNIILDIGNVICEWNPHKLIASVFSDSDQQQALTKIIEHSDWLALDKGMIDLPEAISNAASRSALATAKIAELYQATPASLIPITPMINAINSLSAQGHDLYVLSNMAKHSWCYLADTYDFWHHFNGIVVSHQIKLLKPDRAIFEYIVNRYQLAIEQTIFLDDVIANIVTAEKLGIQSHHVPEAYLGADILLSAVTRGHK